MSNRLRNLGTRIFEQLIHYRLWIVIAVVGIVLTAFDLPWTPILNIALAILFGVVVINFIMAIFASSQPGEEPDEPLVALTTTVVKAGEEAPTGAETPEDLPDVLINAWRRFISYDTASIRLKTERIFLRTIIIILGVIISALAVLMSYDNSQPGSRPLIVQATQITLAVLPIVVSILIAFASEFAPSTSWAVYRVGAELIRREIFLYRLGIDEYANEQTRDLVLDQNVKKATRLENIRPGDKLDTPVIVDAVSQVLGGNAQYPHPTRLGNDQEIIDIVRGEDFLILETRLERIFKFLWLPYRFYHNFSQWLHEDQKPLPNVNVMDDGFSRLSIEHYVDYRLVPQLTWYINRIRRDYDSFRKWKRRILITGGLGSILVAVAAVIGQPLEPLVAVTTSASVALGLYLELRMYNHTYLIYSTTKQKLLDLHDEWDIVDRNTPPALQKSRYKDLINKAEETFQAEREQWMIQVIQTQTALEQKLAKTDEQSNQQDGSSTVEPSLNAGLLNRPNEFDELKRIAETTLVSLTSEPDNMALVECAAQAYGAVMNYYVTEGVDWDAVDRDLFIQQFTVVTDKLGQERFDQLVNDGENLTIAELIDCVAS